MLKRQARRLPEIPLTSLVDIFFNILAFVLVVGSLEQAVPQELRVDLPRTAPIAEKMQDSNNLLHIVLDRQGVIRLNNRIIPKERLAEALKQELAGRMETVIWADRQVPYEDVVQLMALVRDNGGAKITLAVLAEGPQ
ncbi:MAG TPA: biopolymer transporter ExbD [Firmicutes bacterium]|jgi:biopolymer transport protein ExbD|nr:biopolymer transporter ExbD [Bacillota bacterium]HOQ23100.1 biopolymer transporter ExbD [Bacillota bacterium]HPT66997.1 biopolymer transporter ExbD [Bacillota bacterium]